MPRSRYDFVLFDADNTLFDFDEAERTAIRESFAQWGYPLTPRTEGLYRAINRPLWDAYSRGEVTQAWLTVERFRRLAAELGGEHDPAQMNDTYLAYLGGCAILYPGALDLLRLLSTRCRVAIVTNGLAVVQEARLRASPVAPYLSGVFVSETLGCQKPDPRFFDAVCTAMGITDRRRAVVVGDTPDTDILGGNNAGIDTIWYNPCGKRSAIVPTWTVAALGEIPTILFPGGDSRPDGGEI